MLVYFCLHEADKTNSKVVNEMVEEVDAAFDFAAQRDYFSVPIIPKGLVVDDDQSLEGQNDSAVLGSTVAAYDEELSEEERAAFDDTVLYAEIRADEAFNRETQRREWYREYSKALTMCGWPTVNDPYREYVSQELNFTMDEAALQIISLVAGADKLKILPLISTAFNSLEKNDGAIKLVEHKSKKNKSANFQVVPCVSFGGRPTMIACAMQLETSDVLTKVLFFRFKREQVRIYNAATRRTLNRRAYDVVKDLVRSAVDKKRLEYFKTQL